MSTRNVFAFVFTLVFFLSGCGTTAVVVPVEGNHHCHPSSDLPAHKSLKPVPEIDQQLGDFFSLFSDERRQHAADDRDYNSLHDQCVDPAWGPKGSKP